jgi:predicted transposase/invertase (TIGR01784 family)
MQMIGLGVYPQRVLYYSADLHSQQLHAGDSYGQLRPTISISFVNSVLFPDVRDYHLNFQLRSLEHPDLVFSDHQSIHVIELPKFQRSADELVDPLDVWCYFLKHGAELDTDRLPRALDTPAVRRAMEILTMMTQNELERDRYQSRVKAERDRISFLEERDDALKRALEQGLQQGLQQGVVMGEIHALQRFLKLPLTPQEELRPMSLAELQARAEALAQQLEAGR